MKPLITVAVLVLLGQTVPAWAQSPPAPFNPLVNVSNTAGQVSDLAGVTLDGATTYVVWREEVAGGLQIRLRRSTNGGVSFLDGSAGRIAATVDPAETVHSVRVAAAGPLVYVLYTSGLEPRLAKARLARSVDGGATFTAPVALADTLEHGGSSSADLAVDGTGVVHVVLEDRDFSEDIQYLFSIDEGATFSAPAALASSPEPSVRPRVAAKGAQIAVVWEELLAGPAGGPAGDIAFIHSIDAGATFGAVLTLSANAADSRKPAIAIGNRIHVLWIDGDNVTIQSSLDGTTFSLAQQIGMAPPGESIAGASVGAATNTVHVSWTTVNADGVTAGPFYRRSTDGAATFADTQDLRGDSGGAPFGGPAIINGTVARIVWPHSPSGFAADADVHFAAQPNCAISWAAPVSGNWNDATKWSPAVIPVAGSTACIAADGDPYTVTVAGSQNVGELTIGHAASEHRPIVRVTGSLTVGTSLVNSSELILAGPVTSATGVIVNSERGRLSTAAGAPGAINGSAINYGEVDLSANLTILGNLRTFTNFGSFMIRPGAATPFGGSFVFNQNGGVLKVEGRMEFSAEFNTAGDTFNFNGGSVEGVVIIQGHSRLNIGPGSVGAGTFQFERNSANAWFAGNIAPGQTLRLVTQPGAQAASVVAANGFTNAGTIVLDAAALVVTAGTLVNTGMIAVEATSPVVGRAIDANIDNRGMVTVAADLSLRGTNRTFTNTGTVRVFGGATVLMGSTAVFNQQAGVLDVDGPLVLSTEFSTGPDTFNFNGGNITGAAGVHLQSTSRLNIAASAQGGAGLFVYQSPPNSGTGSITGNIGPQMTVRLQGHNAVAANGFTNAGTIVMDAASLVVTAGTLVNTGTIAVEAGAIDANIDNRGMVTVAADLSLRGTNRTFTNTGTVRVFGGATVSVGFTAVFNQQAGELDAGGPLVLNTEFNTGPDTFNFNGGHITGAEGVHLQSTSRLNIAASAQGGAGRFVYRSPPNSGIGSITGNIGPQMTVRLQGHTATAANGFTNAGAIVMTTEPGRPGTGLTVTNGVLVNTGSITVEPSNTVAPINAVIENDGRITINDTITLSRANANHLNRGVVEIASGNTLTLTGNSTLRNLPPGGFGGAGTLSIANGSTFTAAGALAINVTNAGRFRPGASPGIVNITGGYTQTTTGRLEVEIAGAAAGSGFDQVNVAGVATLAGTLDVQVAAGFCIEGSYPFLTYAVVAGDFPTRLGLTASGGRSLVPSRGATAYALNASGPPCNEAPVANADAYTIDEGTPLNVAAPGVLGNDTDAQGDALTAIVAAGPTNGTLILNPDGSFMYTPNPGFSGTDGFNYRASDGTAQSGIAAVTISVLATAPPVITTLTPDRLTVGLVRALQISGAHFSAPTITLRKGDLEVRGNVLLSTPTTIHAEFDVTAVPPGDWIVTVENQNGRRVEAPIFLRPAIIVVGFFWDGIQGFPLMPAGRVSGRANYLTVINVGLTDGMVPVTLELPHPAMRLKVGAHSEPMHTGGSVTFLVWAPLGVEVRVPLYWGISREDVNLPGASPDPLKPTFGEALSFRVHAPMGLTAGSGQVTEMLVRLFGAIFFDNGLPLTVLYRVAHEATSRGKEEMLLNPGTYEFSNLLNTVIDHLRNEPIWQNIDINKRALLLIEFEDKIREAQGRDVWSEENLELARTLAANNPESISLAAKDEIWRRDCLASWWRDVEIYQDRIRRREKVEAAERWKQAQPEADKRALELSIMLSESRPASEAKFEGQVLPPGRSQDPNDKAANTSLFCQPAMVSGTPQCAPYFVGPEHTADPIEYVIQFENLAEATAAAQSVVITDVLDDDLDPSTLQIVTTSHPSIDTNPDRFSFDVVGNVATFRWTGIDLPPNVESPEGEGYVMFTIEPRPGLASGTEIRNSASIVFDFNPPIVTPEVVHVVDTNPPVTTATPSDDPNINGWNNTDVTVTLRGDDGADGSGVKEIHVMVDGGSEQIVAGAAAVVSLTDEGVHTISYFAVDNVGNTEAGRVLTVRIDKTAPIVGSDRTLPNVHGWNNGDVTVVFSAEDALSGIDGASTVETVVTEEGANQSVARTFADLAGNIATAVVGAINIDKTAPLVTGARQTLPNRFGWNNGPVIISFTASDALSGIDGPPVGEVTVSDEGAGQSASLDFTDQAGNSASATVGDINIDLTPPTIAGGTDRAPNEHGWYNADVAVSFTCADALSGVDACGPTPQVISEEGKNLFRIGVVTDRAGNTSQTTVGGVNLDKTAPAVACSNSAPTLWPPNHKLIAVQTAVTVTDDLSGALGFKLAAATSNEPDNGLGDGDTANDIQGFMVGTPDTSGMLRAERSGRGTARIYSLVYDGMDLAGNTATCTTGVTVPHGQAGGKK